MKAAAEKQIIHMQGPPRSSLDFSSETSEARRQWADIFKVLKERRNCELRILYPANLSFQIEGETNIPREQKLRELLITAPYRRCSRESCGWKERALDRDLKPYCEVKISVKVIPGQL